MNTKAIIMIIIGAIIGLVFGNKPESLFHEHHHHQPKLIMCNFNADMVDWSVPENKPSSIILLTNDSLEMKNDEEIEIYKKLVRNNCAQIWRYLEDEEIFMDQHEIYEMEDEMEDEDEMDYDIEEQEESEKEGFQLLSQENIEDFEEGFEEEDNEDQEEDNEDQEEDNEDQEEDQEEEI